MKTLREFLDDYLSERRAHGTKLHSPGYGLLRFVDFMEKRNATFITSELAVEWAFQGSKAFNQASARAQCLGFVREFAKYVAPRGVRTEIPPYGILPHPTRRTSVQRKLAEPPIAPSGSCSELRRAITDYLNLRQAMGFKLHLCGKALLKFATFMEEHGSDHVTIELALKWAQQPATAKPSTWAQHLGYVRDFAKFRISTDPRTEIPSWSMLPHDTKRTQPYIYSEQEIQALLCATQELPVCSAAGILRRHTYYCLFGLLSVTGMRISEAINLKLVDVDLDAAILTVNQSKFGKTRLVPIHPTTQQVLIRYKEIRDDYLGSRGFTSEYLFVTHFGGRLDSGDVRRKFYAMSKKIGLRETGQNCGPRIHDLRHRFAVRSLLNWYRAGEDVEKYLPVLSTYLGHVKVKDTYWYLTATPELMQAAVKLLEHRWEENL